MIIANDQYICNVEPTGIKYFSPLRSKVSEINTTFVIAAATLPADSSLIYLSDGEFLYVFDIGHTNDNIRRITIPKEGSIRQMHSAANSICTLLVILTETELLLVTDRNGVVHSIRHAIELPGFFYTMDLSSSTHLFKSHPGMPASESSPPANFFLSIALHNLQSIEYRFAVSIVDNTSLSIDIASTSTLIPRVPQRILFFKYFGRQFLFVTTEMLYVISQVDYLAIPIDQSLAKSVHNAKVYSLIATSTTNSNASTVRSVLNCILILFCKNTNCHIVNLGTRAIREISNTNNAEHAYESNGCFCFVSGAVRKDIPLAEMAKYF